MKFTLIIKILDFIHDVLCPFFKNTNEKTVTPEVKEAEDKKEK